MKKAFSCFRLRAAAIARCEEGLAYIEFALSIGVLLIMFYGAIELSRYILIVQKVEKTVDTLTDVLTQATPGDINNVKIVGYLNAASELMAPYVFSNNGTVILTDISTDSGGTPTIMWQVCGGGTLHASSKIGTPNATGTQVTLPSGFTVMPNEEMVIGEIYYNYSPILVQNIVTGSQVYRTAIFKPRFGYQSLDNPNTVTSVPCS